MVFKWHFSWADFLANRHRVPVLSFFFIWRDIQKIRWDQMLAVVVLTQHRVSSSKTVRPATPPGARCMEHVEITWSAV